MKQLAKTIFITLFGILPFFPEVNAQGLPIGNWRDHLPYNKTISITQAGGLVYAATPYSIFYIDKNDWSINRLNKVNGLSDIGVTSVSYSPDWNTVVVTYENANIDLIQHNEIVNIPDIKRKPILGKKSINKAIVQDRYAWLCCGFGIVLLDLAKNEIKDTYYIGPEGSSVECFDLTFSPDSIFVATESGVYKASRTHPNLSNYSAWTKDLSMIHPDLNYNAIEYFHGDVIVNYSSPVYSADTMFIYNGLNWDYYDSSNTSNRYNINAFGDYLVIPNSGFIDLLDTNLTEISHVFTYFFDEKDHFPNPMDAFVDNDMYIWIADKSYGLIKNWDDWNNIQYLPEGPSLPSVFSMSSEGHRLVTVPGGRNLTWGNIWTAGSVHVFEDEHWKNLDRSTDMVFDTVLDILSVAVDPLDPDRIYAGSWGRGLLEIYGNQVVERWDTTNSSLRPPAGTHNNEVKAGSLKFDANHNLWITNSSATNVLSVRKSTGSWRSFNIGALTTGATGIDVGDLAIDAFNQKWMVLRGNKILVFNDNNTIDNPNDDKAKTLSGGTGQGAIPGTRVFSIAVDKEGLVWVGTDEGVVVFYTPENVFSTSNFDAQRIFVTQDGYTQYLLESEVVTSIAVDGANRKWFGTERAGVFLMSADGTKEILHFTAENSPLLSNLISAIEIDDVSGEVFFGTDKGIISYKGTATEGGESNATVYAYPNPVESGYTGVIAVKGLVKNADVKITDIAGNLVYHTRAEGGQAIWNGKTMDGKRPGTGVYLVFISNEDGSETYVSKILFKN